MTSSYKIAAAIDIGSSAIRMKIAQLKNDHIDELERLEYPLNLGHETFTHGGIRFSTMEAGAEILKNYYQLIKSYNIPSEYIRVTATTALREADNRDYVLDQIKIKTDRDVTVLEDGQEKALIFRETLRRLYDRDHKLPKTFLMAYIGTGSVGLAVARDKEIIYAQNIKIGSLKLNEMMETISEHTIRPSYKVLEEYLDALTHMLKEQVHPLDVEGFVVTGKEVELIASILHVKEDDGSRTLPAKQLKKLYQSIREKSSSELMKIYNISQEQADILLPSLAIYRNLMSFTTTDSAIIPGVMLNDALLYRSLCPKEAKALRKQFEDSIVASSRFMAKHYHYDEDHAKATEVFSLLIFDNLKKVHGFSRRERVYLQVAAILHDIGKFISSKNHHKNTLYLLLNSSLIDITDSEMAIIANIARYHSDDVPDRSHDHYMRLSRKDRLTVSKLSAILRLADALDRSHLQKITELNLKLKENRLQFTAYSDKDITLEAWTFAYKSQFFEEVFGIQCSLDKKGFSA